MSDERKYERISDELLTDMFIGTYTYDRTREFMRKVIHALRAAYKECDAQTERIEPLVVLKEEVDSKNRMSSEHMRRFHASAKATGRFVGDPNRVRFGYYLSSDGTIKPQTEEQKQIQLVLRLAKQNPSRSAWWVGRQLAEAGLLDSRLNMSTVGGILKRELGRTSGTRSHAVQMKMDRSTRMKSLREAGICTGKPPLPKKRIDAVLALRRGGLSYDKIHKQTGIARNTIMKYCRTKTREALP